VQDEEKLLQSNNNIENKDDFWINLSELMTEDPQTSGAIAKKRVERRVKEEEMSFKIPEKVSGIPFVKTNSGSSPPEKES
jgi:hypothetical protein